MILKNSELKSYIGLTSENKVGLYFSDIFNFNECDNTGLIMPKNPDSLEETDNVNKKRIQLFIPDGFIKNDKGKRDINDKDYNDVVCGKRDYFLITRLKETLFPSKSEYTDISAVKNFTENNSWNPETLYKNICILESHLTQQLKEYVLDEEGLLQYFSDIQNVIFADKIKRYFFANEIYNIYLEQKNIPRLLLLVFLSLLLCYKYENGNMNYLPLESGGLSPNVQAQKYEIEERMKLLWYNKTAIVGLMNKYVKNSDAVNISSFFDSLPLLLQIDENFKFSIAQLYMDCGDYAKCYDMLNTITEVPDAYILLSNFYKGEYGTAVPIVKDIEKYNFCINKAKELGDCGLILSEIEQLSDNAYDKIRLSSLLGYISDRIFREHTTIKSLMNDIQLSDYYYYKARNLDNDDRKEEAQNYYLEALKKGNELARKKINKKARTILEYKKRFAGKNHSGICIVNSSNSKTSTLLFTLPEDYAVFSIDCNLNKRGIKGAINFKSLKDCIDNALDIVKDSPKPVFIALLNDDKNLNLNSGLEVLDRLFNEALTKKGDEELNKFIELFDIHIKCDYDYASVFVDASLGDMGDKIYFKTHIVDTNKNAIQNLIYEKPLFIPCLNGDNEVNVCVCGFDNKFNISVCREIMGIGCFEGNKQVSVSLFSNNHKELTELKEQYFPGLYSRLRNVITPKIANTDFSQLELLSRLTNDKAINYIIVNVGSDVENIQFAIQLRRHLLVKSDGLDRRPFIAVYCKDPRTAFLANRITLSNVKNEERYHNNYDLYFFGTTESLFSYKNLVNNKLDKQAFAIHLSYANEYNTEYEVACKDYYSYQYNQDSSLNTAICLRYRLYSAGVYNDKNSDGSFTIDEDSSLKSLSIYESKCYSNIEKFAEIEQIRWNNFMISRGWISPSLNQLRTYLNKPNISNHKYMLAKLHPYIANWDDLDDKGDICNAIKLSNKKFSSPKEITRDSVVKTTKWLSMFKTIEKER